MPESESIVVLVNSPGRNSLRYVFSGAGLAVVIGPNVEPGEKQTISDFARGVLAQVKAASCSVDVVPQPRLTGDLTVPEWAKNDSVFVFLREAWHQHLIGCDLCNYPTDCFMCDVSDEPGPHNCACPANGGGWGFRLSRLYDDYFKRLRANADIRRDFQTTIENTLEHMEDPNA